jgi:hypothetical protein
MTEDKLEDWARAATEQVITLHLYSDDPAPITFGKISDLILSVLVLASMEWREIMLRESEN